MTDEVIAALEAKLDGVPVTSQNWMVAAANPLAVEAGARVLRAGGSAADAMVAVQVVLGWSNRNPRAWAAVRFWSGTMLRPVR